MIFSRELQAENQTRDLERVKLTLFLTNLSW